MGKIAEAVEKIMMDFWKTPQPNPYFKVEYVEFPDGGFKVKFHKKDLALAIERFILDRDVVKRNTWERLLKEEWQNNLERSNGE